LEGYQPQYLKKEIRTYIETLASEGWEVFGQEFPWSDKYRDSKVILIKFENVDGKLSYETRLLANEAAGDGLVKEGRFIGAPKMFVYDMPDEESSDKE
jgi:hypothetical protein